MLKFLNSYRNHLQRTKLGVESDFPASVRSVNSLLKTETLGHYYKVVRTKDKFQVYSDSELGQSKIVAYSLKEASEIIFKKIETEFPFLFRAKYSALLDNCLLFPKKQQKLVEKILNAMYEIEPKFDVNCYFLPPESVAAYLGCVDPDAFGYIIHDGGAIYDNLSYQAPCHTESFLWQYLSQYFELEEISPAITKLTKL